MTALSRLSHFVLDLGLDLGFDSGSAIQFIERLLITSDTLITSQKCVASCHWPPNDTNPIGRGVCPCPAITGQIVGTEGPSQFAINPDQANLVESLLGSILLWWPLNVYLLLWQSREAKGLGLEMIVSRICNWKMEIIAGILSHLTTLSFLNSPISVKQSY